MSVLVEALVSIERRVSAFALSVMIVVTLVLASTFFALGTASGVSTGWQRIAGGQNSNQYSYSYHTFFSTSTIAVSTSTSTIVITSSSSSSSSSSTSKSSSTSQSATNELIVTLQMVTWKTTIVTVDACADASCTSTIPPSASVPLSPHQTATQTFNLSPGTSYIRISGPSIITQIKPVTTPQMLFVIF